MNRTTSGAVHYATCEATLPLANNRCANVIGLDLPPDQVPRTVHTHH
jgi:hypothetical protein